MAMIMALDYVKKIRDNNYVHNIIKHIATIFSSNLPSIELKKIH